MPDLRIGELFSGYSGLGMGVQAVLGGDIAWHSEIDPGACKILAHRYPDVPNLGDIERIGLPYSDEEWKEIKAAQKFHGAEYEMPTPDWSAVEPVDVLTGGFPCQDVSAAGKREGIRPGTRSGLWGRFLDAIEQLHPSLVVIENVRGLLSADAHHPAHSELEPCPWELGDGSGPTLRALGAVLGDLADIGFDAEWVGLRAADVGAPHGRFRVFVVAWPAADAGELGRDGRAGVLGGRRNATVRSEAGDHASDEAGASAHSYLSGLEGGESARGRLLPDGGTAPHAPCDGRHEGRPEPARLIGGSDAALGGDAAADADCAVLRLESVAKPGGGSSSIAGHAGVEWGAYGPAVRRWERVLGRPAPSPTEPGRNGSPRLSPAFVEWLMGLPVGWVTDVPGITRNEALKALGNGVVPQQAAAALRLMLPAAEAAA